MVQVIFIWFYVSLILLGLLVLAAKMWDGHQSGKTLGEAAPILCTTVLVNFLLAGVAMGVWIASKT